MSWTCPECGAVNEGNQTPCPECEHDSAEDGDGGDDEPERIESFVWACPECGRRHVKNSPPCSRCGNPMLERREGTVEEDVDVPSASYLAAVRPYAPLVALFAIVIGLTASGTVTLGMLPWHGPPSLPEAPGDADVSAGLDLGEVERQVHDLFEAEREAQSEASRSYDSELAHLAAYLNRDWVRVEHGEEAVGDPDPEDFDFPCSGTVAVQPYRLPEDSTIDSFDGERDVAESIDASLRADPVIELAIVSSGSAEGLDVHVDPDGLVYVYYAKC